MNDSVFLEWKVPDYGNMSRRELIFERFERKNREALVISQDVFVQSSGYFIPLTYKNLQNIQIDYQNTQELKNILINLENEYKKNII